MSLTEMADLGKLDADAPCPGVGAVHALTELGMDDHAVEAGWKKLAGRPVGRVRTLLEDLNGEKPELIQTRLTAFGKDVKPL